MRLFSNGVLHTATNGIVWQQRQASKYSNCLYGLRLASNVTTLLYN